MPQRLYIPQAVRSAIAAHVEDAIVRFQEEFGSASEDEDTATGHLGARLQVRTQTVEVADDDIRGPWKWSLDYKKFRGRGPGATEKLIGADGVFELTVDRNYRKDSKSLLFQSKMVGQGGKALFEQCIKLSTWREAAVVVEYSQSKVTTISRDDVVASRGNVRDTHRETLAHTLGKRFIECEIGDTELSYDATRAQLVWRATSGEVVGTRFRIAHRFRVNIEPPRRDPGGKGVDRVIDSSEIHKFRMAVSDEDILGVEASSSMEELKASQKRMARAYHPDRLLSDNTFLRDLLNSRMQEANTAATRIGVRIETRSVSRRERTSSTKSESSAAKQPSEPMPAPKLGGLEE
jgi:hypothetical protein